MTRIGNFRRIGVGAKVEKRRGRRLPSPAMIVALIALFVALGGSATAALVITGANIKNGTVSGLDLKNGSVTGLDVKESSLAKVPDANKLDGLDSSNLVPGGIVPSKRTIKGTYGVMITATGPLSEGMGTISFGASLAAAPSAVLFMGPGVPSSPECPGSAANPKAAPGHLCVYAASQANQDSIVIRSALSDIAGEADPFGAVVVIRSLLAGDAWSVGTWAVTAP